MRIALYVDDVITRGSEKEARALFKAIDEKDPGAYQAKITH